MDTEAAFISNAYRKLVVCHDCWKEVTGVIRARNDTCPASYAPVGPLEHKPVRVLECGLCGTVSDAYRIVAVIAEGGHYNLFYIREFAPVLFLKPYPPDSERDAKFCLARHHAGASAGAPFQVYHHGVSLPAFNSKAWRCLKAVASLRHKTNSSCLVVASFQMLCFNLNTDAH